MGPAIGSGRHGGLSCLRCKQLCQRPHPRRRWWMALPLNRMPRPYGREEATPKDRSMTSKSITSSVYDWVDERLGLSELAAFARHKTVPVHSQSFWYYWGGISLFLFLVQCFTGVLLLVYFRPGAEAYESVRQITFV